MLNPIDFKHNLVGGPLKEIARRMGPSEDWTDESVMIALYVAGWTAAANLLPAATLIQAGVRGETYFSGLSIGYHASGFPKPMFNYITPWSKAEMIGARIGGRIHAQTMYNMGRGLKASTRALTKGAGYKIGARIGGRLIPGVGWALLAYDVYDVAFNQSLWGFDFA